MKVNHENKGEDKEGVETMTIKIPRGNWYMKLASAIEDAPRGATVECHSEAMKELGEGARTRMGRDDVKFIVKEKDDD